MQLYFIRHAQSQNNLLFDQNGNDHGRLSDPPITDIGWQQAECLAEFLKNSAPSASAGVIDPHNRTGFKFDYLYCSLMIRSIQTGTMLAKVLELPLTALADLHEGGGIYQKDEHNGELIGLPGNDEQYFKTHYPHLRLPAEMNRNGWWNRAYEDHVTRRERASRLLKLLISLHQEKNDKIALISHGGFYNHFMGEILGIPFRTRTEENNNQPGIWLSMNNVAISRFDWEADEKRLVYHNRTDFLPDELIT